MPPKNKFNRSNAHTINHGALQAEAESQLDHAHSTKIPHRSARQLLHELEVHQIELETQNETLRQSQVALEESRDRYIDFYDFAPTGYLTLSREALITEINLTGASLLGEERNKLVNRRFSPFVATEDADRWQRFFLSVLNHANRWSCELKLLRAEGTSFYAQLDCLRLETEGRAPLVRIVMTDISERRKTEESLRENEELLDAILRILPVGLWIIDSDGKIVFNNDAALQIWSGAKHVSVAQFNEYKGWKADSGKLIGAHEWAGARAIEKGETILNEEVEIECFDGTHKYIIDSAVPLVRNDGSIRCAITVNYDITARKQLEAALLESEKNRRRLEQQKIVQTSLDGFWVVNANNGQIIEVNDNYCNMVGYSRKEILAMGIQELDVVEKPEETEARLKRIMEVGYDRFETRHRHKQGHLIDIDISISNSELHGGVNFVFLRDISERKQAEDALLSAKTKLEAALDSMSDAVLISDAEGNFIEFNDAFVTFYKFRNRSDCSNKWSDYLKLLEVYLTGGEFLPSEQWPTRRALRGEAASNFELTLHRKDTGETWVGSYSYAPIRDKTSVIVGAVVTGRDITEIKRIMEALKKSEENYRILFENSRDALVTAMAEPPMAWISANHTAVQMFGAKSEAELIGLRPWELSPEWQPDGSESAVKARKMIEFAIQNGSNLFEWTHQRLDGSTFPAELFLTLLQTGELKCIQATIRDLTERKKLEKEIAERRNEMEQLQRHHVAAQTASAIAHEINQPLLAIASYSQAGLMMMKARNPDREEICNALERSEQQALRAGRSIRDLINFLNKKDFPTEPIDFNKEIIDVIGTAKSEHNLLFHSVLKLEEGLPFVRANRTHLQKVLLNLIHNGIDAMEAAGVPLPAISVTVRTAKDQKFAHMTIQDNGPGVKKEDINRLFEPFFTTRSKGIGMGLAISRSLIEENGGQLWVDPQEGSGATFHLTLPFITL